MELNWMIIIVVLLAAIGLIIFLVKRNQKDKQDLIKKLNEENIRPEGHKPKFD